jgi:hypothetical protein
MIKVICTVVAILSVFIVVNFVYPEEQSPRWKYYSTDGAYNDHYYDTKGIVYTKNNIVKVWEKKVATDKSGEVMKTMKELAELKEINCLIREYRTFVTYYDVNSKPLTSHVEPTQWESIAPETWMETLYDIVCKKKGKN